MSTYNRSVYFVNEYNGWVVGFSGIILPIISAYNPKLRVSYKIILGEMVSAVVASAVWYFFRDGFETVTVVYEIEPMLVGLVFAILTHLIGILTKSS